MGLSASSIIPLLSKWEEYLNADPEGDVTGFARWILAPTLQTPLATTLETTPAAAPTNNAPTPTTTTPISPSPTPDQAILLLDRLHRILQLLSKPIAKETGLTNPTELSMLAHTAILHNPNKKELCQQMLIEGSTGVEIIKRLVTKGLIREKPDPKDRRAARLTLTESGQQALLLGYTKLGTLHAGFLDALSSEEKTQLVNLLTLLNDYHTRQHSPLS